MIKTNFILNLTKDNFLDWDLNIIAEVAFHKPTMTEFYFTELDEYLDNYEDFKTGSDIEVSLATYVPYNEFAVNSKTVIQFDDRGNPRYIEHRVTDVECNAFNQITELEFDDLHNENVIYLLESKLN